MQIWVDADACPNVIKEILYRASARAQVLLSLVANQPLRVPRSPYIKAIQVPGGFDMADDYIAQHIDDGDLVVTADIPLAAKVIARGGYALDPRGELYREENIQERLSVRNFLDELRSSGVDTGGPSSLSQGDRKAFADALDRLLTLEAKQ